MSLKKIFIIMCLSAVTASAMAAVQVCPFTDTFDISGPSGIQVQDTPTVSGNLKYTKISSNEFTLSCANNNSANNGDLYINIGTDSTEHLCKLTIYDGPYVMDPEIENVTCSGGLQYNGYDHPFGSYEYTLKFSQSNKKK